MNQDQQISRQHPYLQGGIVNVPIAIIVTGSDGVVREANPAAAAQYGAPTA